MFFCRSQLIIERKKKNEVLAKTNDIQPKIKEIYNYDKYCKDIIKRAKGIQNNLNSFDKDIQKKTILGLCYLNCLLIIFFLLYFLQFHYL